MSPQVAIEELDRMINEEGTEHPNSLDAIVARFKQWLVEQE